MINKFLITTQHTDIQQTQLLKYLKLSI